ncbi:MAG TPA: (d)CMP kinase [Roseiflexaceae bacterium]|nr:(d)CMP kinase [Roseiflexaceae bacterium]HMP41856.1 (d)CMP kinase [Roseiflexaceae bacterium]
MGHVQVITIDGPAGAGKSTLGERLARQLGFLYFDTGVMYRALTLAGIERGVPLDDPAAVTQLAQHLIIDVLPATISDGRQYTVLVDGQDVTWALRRPDVERHVSLASKHPSVREVMRMKQRQIGQRGHVVMVGRDIGSIVMPDAALKIFLDASLEERARRRLAELEKRGNAMPYDEIRADIARRDALDRHVMIPAPDALVIMSDGRTPDEITSSILSRVTWPDD